MGNGRPDITVTLSSRADIERAIAAATWLNRPHAAEVRVAPPYVVDGDRIRRLFNDCGCAWGEFALLAVVVATVFRTLVWDVTINWWWLAATLAVAGVGGKLAGLAWSRHRLVTTLQRLGT
ncbi:MAG: hypothetical protein ACRDP2_15490 [Nocardioidaceae bacterium]